MNDGVLLIALKHWYDALCVSALHMGFLLETFNQIWIGYTCTYPGPKIQN